MPAKAGIQGFYEKVDYRFHGNDDHVYIFYKHRGESAPLLTTNHLQLITVILERATGFEPATSSLGS